MNSIPRPGTLHLVATVSRPPTVIDRTGPANSLAGRGAGYKTRLHQHSVDTRAMPGHLTRPLTGHWSLSRWSPLLVALLQSPGSRCLSRSSVLTPSSGGLSPALLLCRRCTLLKFTRGSHPLHGNNEATSRRCICPAENWRGVSGSTRFLVLVLIRIRT